MSLEQLLAYPWTWLGPTEDTQVGEKFYKMTIDELPGFVVTGVTPYEAITNRQRALRMFLAGRLDRRLRVQLPQTAG